MIIAEHQKAIFHQNIFDEMYFWQDSNGVEVDLLWKDRDSYFATEVKAMQTIQNDLFKQLDKFEKHVYPDPVQKTLLYGGNEPQRRTNYQVINLQDASDRFSK